MFLMLNIRRTLLPFFFLIVSGIFFCGKTSALTLTFSQLHQSIEQGESTRIDILISELTGSLNLAAYSLDILYNQSVLTFDSYELGFELADTWGTDDWSAGDNGEGIINLSELSWLMDFSTQSDSFVLASLFFTGSAAGESDLSFANIILGDEYGESLSAPQLFAAVLEVTAVETNPVPEPTTMILMGTGLIGLTGLRRKRS